MKLRGMSLVRKGTEQARQMTYTCIIVTAVVRTVPNKFYPVYIFLKVLMQLHIQYFPHLDGKSLASKRFLDERHALIHNTVMSYNVISVT